MNIRMTPLEEYLDEAKRTAAADVAWQAAGLDNSERDQACRRDFGFGLRAARQRWDVAKMLNKHGILPHEMDGVDPSKLRELARQGLSGSRDEVIAALRQAAAGSITVVHEQNRKRAEVVPSSVVVACVSRSPTGWSVGLAMERKKGQLHVGEMDGLDSCSEAVGVAIGAAFTLGRLELTFHGSLDLREQAKVRAKLTARDIAVRISPPILPEPPDPRSRWPRFDEVPRGPLARQAAHHLLAVLEGRSTATLPENTRPPVTKEVTAPQRARRAAGRAATK